MAVDTIKHIFSTDIACGDSTDIACGGNTDIACGGVAQFCFTQLRDKEQISILL